ncbi:hypothetical protein [Leifsonia sp. EB41]|uniref:hypothetical protein n=1 Tax=Leifsonia sp. EB41 TaxID=3156260 RepID=UPI003514B4ED
MNVEPIVMLIAGCGSIATGFALVLFRSEFAARNKKNIEASIVGKLFPGFGERSTPGKMIPVGVISVIVGITLIVRSISA